MNFYFEISRVDCSPDSAFKSRLNFRLGDSNLAEYEMFQLLERYSLSLTELAFPVPQGKSSS